MHASCYMLIVAAVVFSLHDGNLSIRPTMAVVEVTRAVLLQDDLNAEITSLVEWAKLLFDDDSLHAFCAAAVPLLQSWIRPAAEASGRDKRSAGNTAAASLAPKLGRKLRNKDAQTVSMYQLALTSGGAPGPVSSGRDSAVSAEGTQQLLTLLDAQQKSCFELVAAFTQVVRVEHIVSKDVLLGVAAQVKMALEKLNMAEFGAEILKKCSLKSIEKFSYSSGRLRTSTVRYVEYNPSDGLGTAGADDIGRRSTFTGAAGRAGSPSGPVVIAWNKIRRPVEDPLITAAAKISERAGLLARKLFDSPHDVRCANDFYSELTRCLETPTTSGGAYELQVPLSRVAASVPRSCIAQYLAGHDYALQRKHGLAIERYAAAFCLDPTQPLVALTLGKYFVRFLFSWTV
jgi:hypothetical protein